MEGSRPLRTLSRTIQERTSDLLKQRFFHDRLSMTMLFAAVAVNGFSLINLALKLQPIDSPVPVHFSSFFLLVTSVVVGIFAAIIAQAFGAIQ